MLANDVCKLFGTNKQKLGKAIKNNVIRPKSTKSGSWWVYDLTDEEVNIFGEWLRSERANNQIQSRKRSIPQSYGIHSLKAALNFLKEYDREHGTNYCVNYGKAVKDGIID